MTKIYKNLIEVSGSLYVRADFQAPKLKTVTGYLDVRANGKLTAPLLKR